MNNDRAWMYQRKDDKGCLNPIFLKGLENFMQYVVSRPSSMNGANIQCPCSKCKNHGGFWNAETVKLHLMKNGFVDDYYVWSRHGEPYIVRQSGEQSSTHYSNTQDRTDQENLMYNMVMDAAGPSFDPEMPNANAQKLYNILKSSEKELYEGCETSKLSAMAQMLSLKSDHHWSEACYDQTSQFFKGILPQDNTFLDSFYSTKKYMEGLGLPSKQIDCCVNGCMIYWGEDINMESCKFCSHARYKSRLNRSKKEKKKVPFRRMIYFPLTPRLQRLYASPETATHMRWHAEHHQEEGVMRHCSDSEEWKQFDRAHPSFSSETRNVRLGLSADGFQPFCETGRQYSSWPIIVTPYNLPPWMYSKEQYLFLSVLVPGPKNPKQKIDVFLQPLIAELKKLWEVGEETWDNSLKQNFRMRAALMWTISDFPAYSMLSGWKTAGHLACPHCAHDHDAYNLSHGGKTTWFDNHRKFLQHVPAQSGQFVLAQSGQRVPPQSGPHSPTQSRQRTSQSGQSTPNESLQLTAHSRQQTPEAQSGKHTSGAQSEPNEHIPTRRTVNVSSTAANDIVCWNFGSKQRDGRVRVEVINGKLEPSYYCSARNREVIYEQLEPTGYNWKSISKATQNFYFEEFKRQSDAIIYKGWLANVRKKYSEIVSVARRNWEVHNRRDNRIGLNVYLSWVEFWKTESFQTLSVIQRGNRRSGVDGRPSTHTSGSASHRTVAARAKVQYKRDPTADEIFYLTHTRRVKKKKNLIGEAGENDIDDEEVEIVWIDKKSQQIYETFQQLREQQEKSGKPVDRNALFLEAVGGPDKKNRVYGVGSSQSLFYQSPTTMPFTPFSATEEENQLLKGQLIKMNDRMKEVEKQLAMVMEATSLRAERSQSLDLDDQDDNN